jgi:hypothetical protein
LWCYPGVLLFSYPPILLSLSGFMAMSNEERGEEEEEEKVGG